MELWLLFPIVTQIEPPRVVFFHNRDFPATAPTLQFLLAYDGVIHVAKVLKPNEPIQVIAFRKAVHLAIPMLVQTARDVVRHPNVQRGAVFVGGNVHPIVVVAHEGRGNQGCFASLNSPQDESAVADMTAPFKR
jgi:hypothetical protein